MFMEPRGRSGIIVCVLAFLKPPALCSLREQSTVSSTNMAPAAVAAPSRPPSLMQCHGLRLFFESMRWARSSVNAS